MENWKEKTELRTKDGTLAGYYVPLSEIDDGKTHFCLHLINGLKPEFPPSNKVWDRKRILPYNSKN